MTQEDKELLLKDLCARLPYGTLVYAQNADDWYDDEINTQVLSDAINEDYVIKPYLFPLSSMTDEQKKELEDILIKLNLKAISDEIGSEVVASYEIDFYNKNHLDYRGLIEMGIAINATGLDIYK